MQGRPEQDQVDNPLRHLTPAQFMALGGNAVVYIRPIKGKKLSEWVPEKSGELGALNDLFNGVLETVGSAR